MFEIVRKQITHRRHFSTDTTGRGSTCVNHKATRRRTLSAALTMCRATGPENVKGLAYSARRSKMRQLLDSARPFVRLVAVIVFLCAARDVAAVDPCTDTSGHKISFVTVAPDVRVEVLDWGGAGPPLILLAGLGNTAHVFDHFAHQFTYGFHVIGITRRGFGASTHPKGGYDLGSRSHDVLMVADALHFDRVALMGHSIAGDEVTKFAAMYPNRTTALVYI